MSSTNEEGQEVAAEEVPQETQEVEGAQESEAPDVAASLATLQKEHEKLQRKAERLEQKYRDQKRLVDQVFEQTRKISRREWEGKLEQLEQIKKQAAMNQDFVAYDQATTDLLKASQALASLPDEDGAEEKPSGELYTEADYAAAFREWEPKNKWYTDNPELKELADGLITSYAAKHGNPSPEDVFSYVQQKMSKFVNSSNTPKGMVAVSPRKGGPVGAPPKADLRKIPEENRHFAETAIDMMFSTGRYKSRNDAVQEYLKRIG